MRRIQKRLARTKPPKLPLMRDHQNIIWPDVDGRIATEPQVIRENEGTVLLVAGQHLAVLRQLARNIRVNVPQLGTGSALIIESSCLSANSHTVLIHDDSEQSFEAHA